MKISKSYTRNYR